MADKKIYQFKLSLRDSKPPIWRRIQVPADYSFRDLHVAIADAMGWKDYHLHYFKLRNGITIGPSDPDSDDLDEKVEKIAKTFSEEGAKFRYEYDMGDGWEHDVVLEKILDSDGGKYPRCVAGKRACPPEDCGGIFGFGELLEKLADKNDPEHDESTNWLEECGYHNYDPAHFVPSDVVFDDPAVRQ
ncbi:plasmid pRiA4b ORF-3-like protein domain-containing protein [Ditylenchus destructor]|uniref:Plasmid pRiA4b ORF-3-like protein domain-containing protein n=1 Tax=Ditylenchus destructor TaxID=166010 RepID=A0AAD4R5V9_9BILA|nr:plasmid pRiA4b ORF-3-like protein domain-containing protein [Ditylenchus destructor]